MSMFRDKTARATHFAQTCIEVVSRLSANNLTTAKKILANGISEQEAIDRAKLGDAECFEALYGLHKRRVYSLCLRMVGNTAEAEDLTQEAFLQLYRKIATFRGESAFSTWLHRLSVNVVLMHLRKKSLPEVSLEETLEPQKRGRAKERHRGARQRPGGLHRSRESGALHREPAAGISHHICIARCRGLRAQRDCRDDGMFHRQ